LGVRPRRPGVGGGGVGWAGRLASCDRLGWAASAGFSCLGRACPGGSGASTNPDRSRTRNVFLPSRADFPVRPAPPGPSPACFKQGCWIGSTARQPRARMSRGVRCKQSVTGGGGGVRGRGRPPRANHWAASTPREPTAGGRRVADWGLTANGGAPSWPLTKSRGGRGRVRPVPVLGWDVECAVVGRGAKRSSGPGKASGVCGVVRPRRILSLFPRGGCVCVQQPWGVGGR